MDAVQTKGSEMSRDDAAVTQLVEREIVQERIFDAPPELVWAAWTDRKHIDRWWGPNGFRNETSSMDFRVGGTWRFVMNGPDGKRWPNWIRFEEIVPIERLVYSHGGEDSEPAHFHVTVTFGRVGARTRLTMRSVFPTAEACAAVKKFGAVEGGRQTLARLAGFLPHLSDGSERGALVLSRLFDAPVARVFEAWSTPANLAKWWGPHGFTVPRCELDFRTGGAYRITMRAPDGSEQIVHGRYQEISVNRRIVFSAVIEDAFRTEVNTTVTFTDDGGRTLVTVRQDTPALPEAAAGQMQGWSETLERISTSLAPA